MYLASQHCFIKHKILLSRFLFFLFKCDIAVVSFAANEINNATVFLSETTFRICRKTRAFGYRIRDIKALCALYAIYNDGSAILRRKYIYIYIFPVYIYIPRQILYENII